MPTNGSKILLNSVIKILLILQKLGMPFPKAAIAISN
jgi:hypothetical protein